MKLKITSFLVILFLIRSANVFAADNPESSTRVPTNNTPDISAPESAKIIRADSKNPRKRIDGTDPVETLPGVDENIRNGLLADKAFAGIAKDVRVTTLDKAVILRGTVKNEEEKVKIEDHVRMLAHDKDVKSELTVAGR